MTNVRFAISRDSLSNRPSHTHFSHPPVSMDMNGENSPMVSCRSRCQGQTHPVRMSRIGHLRHLALLSSKFIRVHSHTAQVSSCLCSKFPSSTATIVRSNSPRNGLFRVASYTALHSQSACHNVACLRLFQLQPYATSHKTPTIRHINRVAVRMWNRLYNKGSVLKSLHPDARFPPSTS